MLPRYLTLVSLLAACQPATEPEKTRDLGDIENRAATVEASSAASLSPAIGASTTRLGPGFVVWESNRTGSWRLWIRQLDGGEARQLTPDEGPRIHCCPHIAPDGQSIAYLSLPADQRLYPRGGAVGRLDWIRPDGSGQKTLLGSARNYYENRSAVWRSPSELIYIESTGDTASFDLASGVTTPLTREPNPEHPWLIDPRLSWAASGTGGFGEFDSQTGRIAVRNSLPGCQPYFSHDGRWVFWVQAPGGPLAFADLASGESGILLKKSDSRLPTDRGYLYFPMLSSDGRVLAFGASPDQFNHFESDYDILVVETDPKSLEVLGEPVRITNHPATDRFPDVWVAPLPLGRHQGEAPFQVQFEALDAEHLWHWDFGDGSSADGTNAEHDFEQPGRYNVSARANGETLRGRVVVDQAAPPKVVSLSLLDGGQEVAVVFDEAVEISGLAAQLGSAIEIQKTRLDRNDHRLRLRLADAIVREDRLELSGVRDIAQRPNEIEALDLPIKPSFWPSNPEGLVFLYQSANAPNLVYDAEVGATTAVQLRHHGRARLDHRFSLLPSGGFFRASEQDAARVVGGGKSSYELTIEAVLEPRARLRGKSGLIVASGPRRRLNFGLEQRGSRIVFVSRTRRSKSDSPNEVTLFSLPMGKPSHIVVTYTPGQLHAFLNGEEVFSDNSLQKGFHHWRPAPLTFGANPDGKSPWPGRAEGLAIYIRVLEAEEVRENFQRYRDLLAARRPIESWRVRATQQRCSPVPTLAEIQPYREALTVCTYSVEEVIDGVDLDQRIRVALWSILDGERIDLSSLPRADEKPQELVLSRFGDNPQLESLYLSDTLAEDTALDLYYWSNP